MYLINSAKVKTLNIIQRASKCFYLKITACIFYLNFTLAVVKELQLVVMPLEFRSLYFVGYCKYISRCSRNSLSYYCKNFTAQFLKWELAHFRVCISFLSFASNSKLLGSMFLTHLLGDGTLFMFFVILFNMFQNLASVRMENRFQDKTWQILYQISLRELLRFLFSCIFLPRNMNTASTVVSKMFTECFIFFHYSHFKKYFHHFL